MRKEREAIAQGARSDPITNNIGYPTGQVSHFLHSQLIDAVNAHVYAQGLTQPDSSAGGFVILAGTEYSYDIGRRCSALPFD
jgi:hypothetical protein